MFAASTLTSAAFVPSADVRAANAALEFSPPIPHMSAALSQIVALQIFVVLFKEAPKAHRAPALFRSTMALESAWENLQTLFNARCA